jgi:hypothetical protein
MFKLLNGLNKLKEIMSVSSNGSDIYIAGSYDGITDFDSGVGTERLATVRGHDIFIQKLDVVNLNILWSVILWGNQ